MTTDDGDTTVHVVAIVTLGVVIVAAIIGMTVVAVLTDRDMTRAELLTAGATALLAALGGVSLAHVWRRRRWRLHVEGDDPDATSDR